jgi:hypothetical protein
MEKSCEKMLSGSVAFISTGGNDFSKGDLEINCHNPADDENLRIYVTCCIPGDCSSCVDPVVSAAASDNGVNIASASSTQSARPSVSILAAGSVAAVGVGFGAILVLTRQKTHSIIDNERQLQAVLQASEMADL